MSTDSKMYLKEALNFGTKYLSDRKVEDSRNEVLFLLSFLADKSYTDIALDKTTKIDKDKFISYLKRRAKGEPSAYITGFTEFMSLPFKVNKNVLIPRQDTELLVEKLIETNIKNVEILDICTGSGCIAVSLAKYISSKVTAVDISKEALKICKENATLNNVSVTALNDDILNPRLNYDKYDIIVSNPPYIRPGVILTLDKTVKDFEPLIALDGGEDGLIFYKKISAFAKGHLNENGLLAFEIGYDQKDDVINILKEHNFKDIICHKDYNHNDRVVMAKL